MHLKAERGEMEIFSQDKEEVEVSVFHRQQEQHGFQFCTSLQCNDTYMEGRLAN